MMEKGKLSFSLQKYYKTPSDRAKGKENFILYCSILNFPNFYGRQFESRSTDMTWNKSVMSWFEVMIKIIYLSFFIEDE